MKRIVALMVFLILLVSSFSVLAESDDPLGLKSVDDETLLYLRDTIQQEIYNRGLESPNGESVKTPSTISGWYSYGLGQYIPNPADVWGRSISTVSDNSRNYEFAFMEEVSDVSDAEFDLYVDTLTEWGYTNDVSKASFGFTGTNNDGTTVVAHHYSSDGSMVVQAQNNSKH